MPEKPDVEMGARVRAKRLRFGRKPDEAGVEFSGEPDHDSESRTERKNLPEEVEPGVTYRDVEVLWLAAARIRRPPPQR